MNLSLARIVLYPIKGLDGAEVEAVRITAQGALERDRAYAIMNGAGKWVNGKREPRLHLLRCAFDPTFSEVQLRPPGAAAPERFVLAEPFPLSRWLGDFLGYPVEIRHDAEAGFPDDRSASGPTVIGVRTLAEVAAWFPGLSAHSARRRFRGNLELDGVAAAPFAEDALVAAPGELKPFAVGGTRFFGHNLCQRCAVPTRDPDTGESLAGFQKVFMEARRRTRPPWANPAHFDHYYRLAVNTSIPPSEAGRELRLGDAVNA